ncbi:PAS domain S-box protein [Pigmentiphaga aceris]|uniref:histidine kinase n=1 Tax=Pigmentiphaga aceris TaxID=1940612 RepID=A0A5C0B3Y0_9BURK|nr:CheR family methyltransferase [Pigmentiphaga aceris]QEI08644.1 PAS domain S-box protein [Pigmentiphaga aceris]
MNQSDEASVPDNTPGLYKSKLKFPVVGIGASAGGLTALRSFFEHMPADCGMAFVVIMHLSPKHESSVDRILQQVTAMPVMQVIEPVPVEKNHIYVIPPALDLTMNDGYLRLKTPTRERGAHVAIDLFMRTLADVHGTHAAAVILSGTGADGSVGLSRIKEQGGVTFAQQPEDAEHEGMPRSAITTGMVDIVLPVADLPAKLVEIWSNATARRRLAQPTDSVTTTAQQAPDAKAAEVALRDILSVLHARTGHDFRHYKRATVLRRIERRMQVNALPDMVSYRHYLHDHVEETPALLSDMLIGVTNFFRDREAYESLEREVISQLFQRARPEDEVEVRVWSVGCSTGEEAYSTAMLLCEQAEQDPAPVKIQVFATDIDEHALAVGRSGSYPEAIVADVPAARLREFFTKEPNHFRIKKEVREKVLFALHNVMRDPPFSRLNLITCRNLLIYLDREVQAEVLRMFHFALNPGGFLFLGSSESADICSNLFSVVDKKNRIYRAREVPGSVRQAPMLASASFRGHLAQPTHSHTRRHKKVSFADVHQRVLEQYAPPSVIVDHDSNIVHMSDRAGRFLRYVGGEPSHNLPSLVYPELRLELRTALFQGIHSGKSVEARRVQIKRDDRLFYVTMVVRPFRDAEAESDFMLVLFDEVEDVMSGDNKQPGDTGRDSVLSQLEAELQRTKEQLQLTIEQSETSTEELKASNEELQAINEELRSATEELETSKEELQSINEELITVNFELKVKVEETSKINDDLQNLITSTDIATVFVDRAMRIKWFTPRAADIFSIIANDAGRSLLDITHRLNYSDLADDASQAFESLRTMEREVAGNDGRWYMARILPYRTAEDRIEGAVLTFIDVTARRSAEQRLRTGEAHLRLLARSTKDYAIITLDQEGLITSWNSGAEIIFGFSEREAIGQPSALIFTEADIAAGEPEKELSLAREAGYAADVRWHRRKDGRLIYCSGGVNPIQDTDLRGYAKIARDITREKLDEAEQQHQLELSQATSQQKDEFFAVMSHELKHPLNLIQLNADLLVRLPAVQRVPVARKATEAIQHSVRSQARIIDDLLDLSRVRTGKLALTRNSIDLRATIKSILDVVMPVALGKGVELRGPTDQSDAIYIDADTIRVEQIVWNLLNNAIKFTPAEGVVTVTVTAEGDMARLDVVDTGEGIEPSFLDRVFEMFSQAEARHASMGTHGLGIGLALVKHLVDAHSGRIEASSDGPGRGSRFSVWLPLASSEPDAQAGVPNSGGQLEGLRILLVDDSQDILDATQFLLETEGALVTTAASGEAGLEQATRETYDLILSDIGMSGMSGHQMLQELRRRDPRFKTPAIALTGYGSKSDIDQALEAGFTLHLSKPIAFDTLIDAARQAIRR